MKNINPKILSTFIEYKELWKTLALDHIEPFVFDWLWFFFYLFKHIFPLYFFLFVHMLQYITPFNCVSCQRLKKETQMWKCGKKTNSNLKEEQLRVHGGTSVNHLPFRHMTDFLLERKNKRFLMAKKMLFFSWRLMIL